tara:strand:+ start:147 stop:965 length:819 start_codon:yes stop_codon:yes gene_type:complete
MPLHGIDVIPDASISQTHLLRTTEGDSLVGRILSVQDGEVTFSTQTGLVLVPSENIVSLIAVSVPEVRSTAPPHTHPNQTRILFAPTGRTLGSGSGYVADHLLFFPAFAVGVTDRLTVGGGFSFIPGISLSNQLFFLTPKLGLVQTEQTNLSVGALVGGFPGNSDLVGTAGVVYGVGTFGPVDRSLTVGVGFGFAGTDLKGEPVFVIGGEARVSKEFALISENWIVVDEPPLLSVGCRMFGERFSVDLAIVGVSGDAAVVFPYIDLVYAFGH